MMTTIDNLQGRRFDTLPDVLSPVEAAKYLRRSKNTIYKLLKSGELKGTKCGERYLVSRSGLLAFLNGSEC